MNLLNIGKIPVIDRHSHERIMARRLFKECSNRSYERHESHNVLYGSHNNPIVVTYIPEGTVSKLLIQAKQIQALVGHHNKMTAEDVINKVNYIHECYAVDPDVFKPIVVDRTNTDDADREYKQEKSQERQDEINDKRVHKQNINNAKLHPKIIHTKSWQDAAVKTADILMRAYYHTEYSSLKNSIIDNLKYVSKTDHSMYLAIYNSIIGTKLTKKDLAVKLAHKVGCATSTAYTGVKRADSIKRNCSINVNHKKRSIKICIDAEYTYDWCNYLTEGYELIASNPMKNISKSRLKDMANNI